MYYIVKLTTIIQKVVILCPPSAVLLHYLVLIWVIDYFLDSLFQTLFISSLVYNPHSLSFNINCNIGIITHNNWGTHASCIYDRSKTTLIFVVKCGYNW